MSPDAATPGFVIPHRHAARCRPLHYPAVLRLLATHEAAFLDLAAAAETLAPRLLTFAGPPPLPRFDQDWFPRLDAAAAYTLVRRHAPPRIVEIGSGHSTRFMVQAVRDSGRPCRMLCIDPAPRAGLAALGVEHLPVLVQDAGAEIFAALRPGDLLSIDSSHVAMPGTDVDLLFSAVLPELPAGVLVHIHDSFLPDPYPPEWAWRGYNEQLLTAAWLLSGRLRPLFAAHYAVTRMGLPAPGSALARLPLLPGAHESSLWATLG